MCKRSRGLTVCRLDYAKWVQAIISNFQVPKRPEQAKPYIDWTPSLAELDALISGEPLTIQVYTPGGEIFQYQVDEATTVESLLQEQVWKEKFFQKEPDSEFYWLYLNVDRSDNFDVCLSKDKRVLKVISKFEKANRKEEQRDDGKRFSFTRKKTSKFLRKQTIAAQMETLNDNWAENSYPMAVFIVKKRVFSALHTDKNVKTLPKKALTFLYHQVRNDYIDKNLLKRQSTYEDVALMAAFIMKVKHFGKILRSKDNSLSKDLLAKSLDYAVPASFLREKQQDYWITRI